MRTPETKGMTMDSGEYQANEVVKFSIEDFLTLLPKLLVDLAQERKYLYLLATFSDERYVQFLVEPSATITAEVMSNLYGLDWALTAEDEDELRRLGFIEPFEGAYPNWRYRCNDEQSFETLVKLMKRVVHAVFREQPTDTVAVQLGSLTIPPGESLDNYLVANRGFYQLSSDPAQLRAFAEEIDNLADYLDGWRS
jgi:hypothetical protein